jgi:hypothetical protein
MKLHDRGWPECVLIGLLHVGRYTRPRPRSRTHLFLGHDEVLRWHMKDVTVVKVSIVSAPSAAAAVSHSRMNANLGRGCVAPPGWTPTLSPS